MTKRDTNNNLLSVVIPAFNESLRLPTTINRLKAFAKHYDAPIELIVANDGSTDDTPQVAEQAARGLPFRLVTLPSNSGAGAAIRQGVLAASGNSVLICDADGPVPFAHIDRLQRALHSGAQIALGSRQLKHSTTRRPQPIHRRIVGKAWAFLVHSILSIPIRDTQCGFKLFTRDAAHTIFEQTKENGFAIHVETVVLAQELGFRAKEIPVRWDDIPGSKINLLRDSVTMFWALLRIRQNYPAAGLPPTKEHHHGYQ